MILFRSSDFSKPLITDPSEFDHYYFPEWDRRDGFFQENCFKCTCRNVFLFILFLGSKFYIAYLSPPKKQSFGNCVFAI